MAGEEGEEKEKALIFTAPPFDKPMADREMQVYRVDTKLAGGNGTHLDIGDGDFIPTDSREYFDFHCVANISRDTRFPIEAHMMVHHPTKYAKMYDLAGVRYYSFHFEAKEIRQSSPEEIYKFVQWLQKQYIYVGLAINPETTLEEVMEKLVLKRKFDYMAVMTVTPGVQGGKFIDGSHKIQVLKSLKMRVEVDGGMNDQTSKIVRAAGLGGNDIIVTGSHYNRAKTPEERKGIIINLKG